MNEQQKAERVRLLDAIDQLQSEADRDGLTPDLAMRIIQNQEAVHELSAAVAVDRERWSQDIADGMRSGRLRSIPGAPTGGGVDDGPRLNRCPWRAAPHSRSHSTNDRCSRCRRDPVAFLVAVTATRTTVSARPSTNCRRRCT